MVAGDYRLNTSDMREKASMIRAAKQELEEKMQAVLNQVTNTVGSSWQAPGAVTFQNEFQSWFNQLKAKLEEFEALAKRIEAEAQEYDEAVARLQGASS